MEVPADVAVRELVGLVVDALTGQPASDPDQFQLEAYPPGRVLEPAETLASAAVWDGAWLLISQRNQ